jgi:DNA-binding SARP family transcriptional activator
VLLSTVRGVLGGSHQSLEEGPIVTDRDVVWLDLAHLDVDVEHFLALATAALEAHARRLPQATAQLIAAEARYGGDFLEDDPYQEWAAPLRDEAGTMYASVLRALVRRLQDADDVDRSMRYSLLLLQCDRYEESAHLDLVRMLAKSGRRGEARRRYREYARRMTEIGVHARPFPETGQPPVQSSDAS